MSIEVNIDAQAVQEHVAKAIVDSTLGEAIKKAVEKALQSSYGGGSVVDQAVSAAVYEQVRLYARELVREEFAPQIREAVRAGLTDEKLDAIVGGFVASLGLVTTDDMSLR